MEVYPFEVMLRLTIHWQRLVESGQTCPRCSDTEKEIDKAVDLLSRSLSVLGIDVKLVKSEISLEGFFKSPLDSNQILINDKPLEEWLGAKTGSSECCNVCGDNQCRTVDIGEDRFESIPALLIVKAGLIAVSEMLIVKPDVSQIIQINRRSKYGD